jgi:hypothetical protein
MAFRCLLEFTEISTRIQFAIDCAEQRFNAVFFPDYTSDSNSVSFKFQLIRFVEREHYNWDHRQRS